MFGVFVYVAIGVKCKYKQKNNARRKPKISILINRLRQYDLSRTNPNQIVTQRNAINITMTQEFRSRL